MLKITLNLKVLPCVHISDIFFSTFFTFILKYFTSKCRSLDPREIYISFHFISQKRIRKLFLSLVHLKSNPLCK